MAQDAIILPDKRAALLNSFLQNYQQGRATDVQAQDAQQRNSILQQQADTEKQARNQQFAEALSKLGPTERQRVIQIMQAHPDQFGGIDPQSLNFPASQAEQNAATVQQTFAKTFPTLPQGAQQQGAYQTAYNAPMPAPTVNETNAQDVYGNKKAFASEMQGRQQIADQTKMNAAESAQEARLAPLTRAQTAAQGNEAAKTAAETTGINLNNKFLGDMSGGVPTTGQPQGPTPTGAAVQPDSSAIVKALANREFDPKMLRQLVGRNPALANSIEAQVKQVDPSFSMADYEANVATKKAYASGPQAQNITAVNTAIRHLNTLYDDFQKMNNTRFPRYNIAANTIGAELGNESIQEHSAAVAKDADAVANELNKAFRGSSQLSEKETASWRQGIGPNATPAEIKGAISAAINLLNGRNVELAEGYKRGVGRSVDRQFIDQGAQNIVNRFRKLGVGSTDISSGGQNSPQSGNVIPTPDGLRWIANADGTFTQVQ